MQEAACHAISLASPWVSRVRLSFLACGHTHLLCGGKWWNARRIEPLHDPTLFCDYTKHARLDLVLINHTGQRLEDISSREPRE